MIETLGEILATFLGTDRDIEDVNALQVALRAVIVYAFALAIVRLGSKRLLGKGTAFDIILAIIIGSVLSRGINGSAPFGPTLVAGVVLVAMHWLLAVLAYHTDWFGPLVKGHPVLLIEDGKLHHEALRGSNVTREDLAEAIRLQGHEADLSRIRRAYLERDGTISVIMD